MTYVLGMTDFSCSGKGIIARNLEKPIPNL